VILIDTNLLLYAHNTEAMPYAVARQWLESTLSRPEPIRLAWASILAFLRLSTDSRVYPRPKPIADSRLIVTEWLDNVNVDILQPTERHWAILQQLLQEGQVRGPLVSDAHLAALAIEHGATLCTTDRDFARFPGLKWMNPIA
jgi:toxin-antitoxin system PIN domain toxin